ncbi:16S rRNA (cytosine(1402)-N(4))-methyltransferase RsmH [Dialister pneumosintes]|uniref:Ribosomal RNA small subunit methyltransferase H n=1 Tax=Dialister pneumosintes TaxID=39950 RepID=A0A1B3WDF2_9FIRM|nr:16S rRNA (cytosine(1402)-N(4))-methyltransferase RsmH [Dialister pneumosintes]AOH38990.1 16S rRNA (cytosine(1402)-N(4))-methyltransferase [Dialister pneumosintes]MBS6479856.1 16S rRNA (cytosine(1402)-N(4))-methyltransferase RsmH [Dialister sp.]RID94045.1 16S rRNA (cytosine(1402)-N(4))-methyltransferase RsmH [Dialister pneumosintes]CDF27323.1 ribosomal RNA small subunit methyltransferase H [Dialister sp. CAG:588]
MAFKHKTVLLDEMINNILTNPEGIYVDCTLGGGGHSCALAQRLADTALLIGIDQDEQAIKAARERLKSIKCNYLTIRNNFSFVDENLDSVHIDKVDGFIFDLGVSSPQLDDGNRGFSYMNNGDLDMRMDQRNTLTAYEVVNTYSSEMLEKILFEYGEERWGKRIVQFILKARKENPIKTTNELVHIIKAAIPQAVRREGSHPAKRTFQAIRIEVNNELKILEQTMKDCVRRLKPGGRLGVITFQSLEDRIIKNVFKLMETACVCPPEFPVCMCHHTKEVKQIVKAQRPTEIEIKENPRARSAILRVVEKI